MACSTRAHCHKDDQDLLCSVTEVWLPLHTAKHPTACRSEQSRQHIHSILENNGSPQNLLDMLLNTSEAAFTACDAEQQHDGVWANANHVQGALDHRCYQLRESIEQHRHHDRHKQQHWQVSLVMAAAGPAQLRVNLCCLSTAAHDSTQTSKIVVVELQCEGRACKSRLLQQSVGVACKCETDLLYMFGNVMSRTLGT